MEHTEGLRSGTGRREPRLNTENREGSAQLAQLYKTKQALEEMLRRLNTEAVAITRAGEAAQALRHDLANVAGSDPENKAPTIQLQLADSQGALDKLRGGAMLSRDSRSAALSEATIAELSALGIDPNDSDDGILRQVADRLTTIYTEGNRH